jgi:hypothetical protein
MRFTYLEERPAQPGLLGRLTSSEQMTRMVSVLADTTDLNLVSDGGNDFAILGNIQKLHNLLLRIWALVWALRVCSVTRNHLFAREQD